MLAKRIVVPISVLTLGSAAAIVGVMNADAAAATACSVTYTVAGQWSTGFTGDVKIKNTGGTNFDGWKLGFAFPSGQKLAGGWNGSWTQAGTQVTVADAGWNKTVAPGGQVTLGFNGIWSGVNSVPAAFTVNGVTCGGAKASPSASASRTATASPSATKTATATPKATKTPTASPTATPSATITKGAENCTDFAALVRGNRGNIGWEVYSFVRTADTSAVGLNLTAFTNDLVARGWLAKTKYLSSVQAGTEIFTGSGRLDTTAYSVKIG